MKNEFKMKYLKKQKDIKFAMYNPPFPRIVKIDTCNSCNYSCIFCPQSRQINKKGNIDKELCLRIIKDSFKAGARELCLSMTGEPLLNSNIELFTKTAKDLGYEYVFLNTNGLLLDSKRCKTLIDSGIDSVKFSINAAERSYELIHGQNCFNKVIENLKNMRSYINQSNSKCRLYVSYIATRYTKDEANEVEIIVKNYVDDITVINANNRGGLITEVDKYLYAGEDEFSFQYPCSQLFNNVYITAEGYMIICCQDFENVTVVADLNKVSVTDGWNGENFVNFRKRYLNRQLKGTLCYNCLNNKHEAITPFNKEVAFYNISNHKVENLQKRVKQLYE